jgi:hypothetical protein
MMTNYIYVRNIELMTKLCGTKLISAHHDGMKCFILLETLGLLYFFFCFKIKCLSLIKIKGIFYPEFS